jgi:non-heme chloroperoxidase
MTTNSLQGVGGARLFYRDWGSGRPVVFVHGWAVNCDIWQYQMAALSHEARCIAYDKRSHGRSSDPGEGYDYDTLADDLASVLERLDLNDAILVGHSMGASEIVRYLTRHGPLRVVKVVLISSALPFMLQTSDNPKGIDASVLAARRAQWLEDMPQFLSANARSFLLPSSSPETVAWVAQMGAAASLRALFELNRTITETDFREELSRLPVPALVIHGDRDISAPIDLAGEQTAAIVPRSRLKVYEGAPHGLLLTHSERLNNDLRQWLGD